MDTFRTTIQGFMLFELPDVLFPSTDFELYVGRFGDYFICYPFVIFSIDSLQYTVLVYL